MTSTLTNCREKRELEKGVRRVSGLRPEFLNIIIEKYDENKKCENSSREYLVGTKSKFKLPSELVVNRR